MMAKIVFGDAELHHLRAAYSQGKSIRDIADEMGVNQATLSKAIQRSEHFKKVSRLYPRLGRKYTLESSRRSEMEVVPFDEINLQVDTGLLHVRAAVMDWRA